MHFDVPEPRGGSENVLMGKRGPGPGHLQVLFFSLTCRKSESLSTVVCSVSCWGPSACFLEFILRDT